MKKKNGFELRDVCGEKLLIAHGLENVDFNKMINLNETAAYLWENTGDGELTAEAMAELLMKEYEVSRDVALADCQALLKNWAAEGIIG